MTSFQEYCINRCTSVLGVNITFEGVIGEAETYYVSNLSVNDHNIAIYIYIDEAGFDINGKWYIFETPDYKSEKELADAFVAKLCDSIDKKSKLIEIKPPIILYDNGDVNLFQSIEQAEGYIESPDVLDNRYVAYDAEGMPLALIAPKTKTLKIFGIALLGSNKVSIMVNQQDKACPDELKRILSDLLKNQHISDKYVNNATLSELVDKCIEVIGYTR